MSNTIQEYIILTDLTKSSLAVRVNEYLKNGWRCQGGVAVGDGWGMAQAMVREREKKSEYEAF